jgi:hypothetical protein
VGARADDPVGVVSAEDVVRGLAQDATDAGHNAYLHRVRVLANVYSQVLELATPQNTNVEETFSAVLSVLVSMVNTLQPANRERVAAQIVELLRKNTQ